ncbi:MAG: hypothetical protein R3D67_12125 [Hyphomicrobiaceae bacterium]
MATTKTIFAFDTADASWLRGYANLVMASVNLFLACDFEATYEATAHNAHGYSATRFGRFLSASCAHHAPSETIAVSLST